MPSPEPPSRRPEAPEEAEALRHRGSPSAAAASSRETRELLLRLRSEVRALCGSYGVPRAVATAYLREAVELAVILCHRLPEPRRYLLERLERRCRAYWQAVMALDGDFEDPTTPEEEDGGPPDP